MDHPAMCLIGAVVSIPAALVLGTKYLPEPGICFSTNVDLQHDGPYDCDCYSSDAYYKND